MDLSKSKTPEQAKFAASHLAQPGIFGTRRLGVIGFDEDVTGTKTGTSTGDDDDKQQTTETKSNKLEFSPEQFKARLERAEAKARQEAEAAFLKKLGVEKLDDATAKLTRAQELEREKMSEAEKLAADKAAAEAAAATATAALARLSETRDQERQNAVIERALLAAGVTDEDALELALSRAKKYITAELDGKKDVQASDLAEFIADLKTSRPVLFSAAAEQKVTTGKTTQAPKTPAPDSQPKGKTAEEIKAMSPADFEAYTQQVLAALKP